MTKGLGTLVAVCMAITPAFAQPANDECPAATIITALPFTDALDVSGATVGAGDPAFDCQGGSPSASRSVWYTYAASSAVTLEIDTFGSDYSTTLNTWSGPCAGPLVQLTCNDEDADDFLRIEYETQARTYVTLAAGETVLIEVTDQEDEIGDRLVLHVRESPIFRVGQSSTDAESPSVAPASCQGA